MVTLRFANALLAVALLSTVTNAQTATLPAVTTPTFAFTATTTQLKTVITWTPTVTYSNGVTPTPTRSYRITVSRNGVVLAGYPKTVMSPRDSVIGPQVDFGKSALFIADIRMITGTRTSSVVSGRSTYTRFNVAPPFVSDVTIRNVESFDSVDVVVAWNASTDSLGAASSYLYNVFSNKPISESGVTKEIFTPTFTKRVKRPVARDSIRLTLNIRAKRHGVLGPWRTTVTSYRTDPNTVPVSITIYPDFSNTKIEAGEQVQLCAFVNFPNNQVGFRSDYESTLPTCVAGYNALPVTRRTLSPSQLSVAKSMCVSWSSTNTNIATVDNTKVCK